MRGLRMLVSVFLLLSLVVTIVVISVKIIMLIWSVQVWGMLEYLGLLLVCEVVVVALYGVLNSYQDKVITARKLKVDLLNGNKKES